MARILLLIVIVFILYLLFRRFFRSQTKDAPPPPATQAKGEDFVVCGRCGVNLPRSEAREEAGRLVCQNNPHCHS